MNQTQETRKSGGPECRERVAALVRLLPGARAIPVGDAALSLEVGGRRFGWVLDAPQGDARPSLNLKAPRGAGRRLARWDPGRFHLPEPPGDHGWVGIWLDNPSTDWEEIWELMGGAYRLVGNEPPVDVLRENINTTTS